MKIKGRSLLVDINVCLPSIGNKVTPKRLETPAKAAVGTKGELPPSFCNVLGTIYIAFSRGRTIDLTTRDMDSEFRYALGKVLDTQDRPTLRLASHHCVLHFNLIKNIFNICIYTHTHTSIYLSIQHGIIIQKHIISIHKAIRSQTHTQINKP